MIYPFKSYNIDSKIGKSHNIYTNLYNTIYLRCNCNTNLSKIGVDFSSGNLFHVAIIHNFRLSRRSRRIKQFSVNLMIYNAECTTYRSRGIQDVGSFFQRDQPSYPLLGARSPRASTLGMPHHHTLHLQYKMNPFVIIHFQPIFMNQDNRSHNKISQNAQSL